MLSPVYIPFIIVNNILGLDYNWLVETINGSSTIHVPDGFYTIRICQTSTLVYDSSDNYFKITSPAVLPTIYPMYIPPSPYWCNVGTIILPVKNSNG